MADDSTLCAHCGNHLLTLDAETESLLNRKLGCLWCGFPTDVRNCPECNTENRGMYECVSCHTYFGELCRIGNGTVFLDNGMLADFQAEYDAFFENIPRQKCNSDIEMYQTRECKRNLWFKKLSFHQKLHYFTDTNKSYPADCFDPNSFFQLFRKLSIKPGYILDYRFAMSDMSGRAAVFARRSGSRSMILSRKEGDEPKEQVLDVIDFERSPEGFLQYALFSMVYASFYRIGHAKYGEGNPIFTRQRLTEALEYSKENMRSDAIERVLRQDIRPRVEIIDSDNAHVTIFMHNRFNSFLWHRFHIENGTANPAGNQVEKVGRIKKRCYF